MIVVKQLEKTFDGLRVLDGVNMHVGKGDIYGLVGPNGAGKTTLIRHLTGIYKPDAGKFRLVEKQSTKTKMQKPNLHIYRMISSISCRQTPWK